MIDILDEEAFSYVKIECLSEKNIPKDFPMENPKHNIYANWLFECALDYQSFLVTKTYLLIDNKSREAFAYISLICDSINVTPDEKNSSGLDEIPFTTFPAIKIAQLAVSSKFKDKYNHAGSFLIDFAADKAFQIANEYAACRFISVDADIENNPDSPEFYKANGFAPMTDRKYTKKTKICCMYKDMMPNE